MGTWVENFNSFQTSTDPAGLGLPPSRPAITKPPSRKEKIQAELKLLEWHKLSNEAALKAALLQTQNLRESAPESKPLHTSEDARWMRRAIEEEHVKPLQVSKHYVLEYEQREKMNAERLTNQVEKHIGTLKKLREKLEERAELKNRSDEYRTWKREFGGKKLAVMNGRTIEEYERETNPPEREAPAPSMRRPGGSGELGNVLDSLNKLSELEKRITSLEKDNAYDQLLEKERPNVNQRTVYEFRKEKASAPPAMGGGMGIMYSINPKKASWQQQAGKKPAVGGGAAAARAKQRQQQLRALAGGGGGGGAFLTDLDDAGGDESSVENDREAQRRERQRQIALAPAGQKSLRNRVQMKKLRSKEQQIGAQKHDVAMKEINRRRFEQQKKKREAQAPAANVRGKGASSGVKTNNKHLQEFENNKAGFKKKQEAMGKAPLGSKFVSQSQTAPALGQAAGGRRVPTTKTGGTVTRRTDMPMRRGVGAGVAGGANTNGSRTAPSSIVVSGVSGVKLLRGQKGT